MIEIWRSSATKAKFLTLSHSFTRHERVTYGVTRRVATRAQRPARFPYTLQQCQN